MALHRAAVLTCARRLQTFCQPIQPMSCTAGLLSLSWGLQLIHEADKVYGISHLNRLSRVDVISKDYALQFVQEELEHQ